MELNFDKFLTEFKNADPRKLRITETDVERIKEEILADIPADLRELLPEDDTLAALGYAQVYYMFKRR